jgi:hypothetical protein
MIGTLVAHCGAARLSRDELEKVPTPQGTSSWKPIRHADLVTAIESELETRGLAVKEEAFAVQRNGALLFGVLDIAWRDSGEFGAALGLRTANDKSMALQIAVGVRVFVCDNLAFAGDLIALRRKHTSGLNLGREIAGALDRYQAGVLRLEEDIARMKERTLQDQETKSLIFDAFHRAILPTRLFRPVSDRFFRPGGDVPTAPERTLWRLHNAFTSEIKALGPAPAFRATIKIGQLLGQ